MKTLLAALFSCLFFAAALADVHVKGYTRKDGTYVAPHVRSSPNSTKADNFSTKGNINPYTGKEGTKVVYPESSVPLSSPSDFAASQQSRGPLSLAASSVAVESPSTVQVPAPTVPQSVAELDEKALMLEVYKKLMTLEARINAVERAQSKEIASLRQSSMAAFTAVALELEEVKNGSAVAAPRVPAVAPGSNPIDRQGSAPSLEQWWKVKPHMSREEAMRILGRPKSVDSDTFYYNGGGFVKFFSDGTVYQIGGYSAQ